MQNKQGSSNQNIAEKVYMMSEQIANAPGNVIKKTILLKGGVRTSPYHDQCLYIVEFYRRNAYFPFDLTLNFHCTLQDQNVNK